jgi:hypothetical protein
MKARKMKNESDDKVRLNIRLLRETKERLERAKKQLNTSETSCIEAGLRLYFRQQGIE